MSTPPENTERARSRRRLALLAAGVATAAAAVALLAVSAFDRGSGPAVSGPALALPPLSTAAKAAPSVQTPGFVGLPLAGHERDVLVGIGARAGGPVDVVVIPSDESDVPAHDVRLRVGGASATGSAAASCGSRCLRFPLRVLAGSPRAFSVVVSRRGKPDAVVPFDLPARLPPAADELYTRARARMLGLRSLAIDETLGSGLGSPLLSHWSFQAPDRLSYTIAGGAKAIVVGTRRWDWGGGRWSPSSTSPVRVPAYPWQDARGALLIGRGVVAGKPVSQLAIMLPGSEFPTWFVLSVDSDDKVARMQMLTTGHFMVDTYRALDAAAAIRPPAS